MSLSIVSRETYGFFAVAKAEAHLVLGGLEDVSQRSYATFLQCRAEKREGRFHRVCVNVAMRVFVGLVMRPVKRKPFGCNIYKKRRGWVAARHFPS